MGEGAVIVVIARQANGPFDTSSVPVPRTVDDWVWRVHTGHGRRIRRYHLGCMRPPFARNVERHDRETIEHWRAATPSRHAAAMVELSEYAAAMARQTGIGPQAELTFPNLSRLASFNSGPNR